MWSSTTLLARRVELPDCLLIPQHGTDIAFRDHDVIDVHMHVDVRGRGSAMEDIHPDFLDAKLGDIAHPKTGPVESELAVDPDPDLGIFHSDSIQTQVLL